MEQNNHTPDTATAPPVPLVTLAAELGEAPDTLAHRLGGDVFKDALGFRVVTRFKASELIRARDEWNAEFERRSAERWAAEKDAPRVPGGVKLDVPEGMLPVQAMVAQDTKPQYGGATYVPAPGRLDWLFNKDAPAGGTIGPTSRKAMEKAAKARAAERLKAKKGGGK